MAPHHERECFIFQVKSYRVRDPERTQKATVCRERDGITVVGKDVGHHHGIGVDAHIHLFHT